MTCRGLALTKRTWNAGATDGARGGRRGEAFMAFRPAVLLRRRIAQLAAAVAAVMALIGFTAAPAAAVGSVGSVSLALSSRAAGATQVTWSVHFKTTSTGALAANSGTITVAGGSGVVVSTVSCDYRITDLTSGSTASCPTLVTGTSKAQVTVPFAIGASHEVSLTMAGTKNGATASSTGTVNTSADLTAVALGNSFVAPLSVANASAARSTTAAGAKGVRWTVQFKANSPLVAGRGQIVVEGATGT